MTDREDFHVLLFDSVQDTVDAVTFAVEKLAHSLSAQARFGHKGTSLGAPSEALDGVAQSVEPFQCHAPSELVEIPFSPLSIQDATRQSASSSIAHELVQRAGLRPLPPRLHSLPR